MRYLWLIVFSIFFSLSALAKSLHYIAPGEILTLPIAGSSNVHISTKKYLMIEDQYTYLKLVGKKPGETIINIGKKIHIIYVNDLSLNNSIKNMNLKLQSFKGLELNIVENKPYISGHLYRLIDWIEVSKNLSNTGYKFKAQIDSDVQLKFKKYIKNQLNKLPKPDQISFSITPEVTYYNTSEDLHSTIKAYFKKWGIEQVNFINDKTQNYLKTIEINLEFYEISLSKSKNYGINWANNMGYQVFPQNTLTGSLEAQIQLLKGRGDAKLVQRTQLKTANSHSVKFVAGGEIAIPNYSYKSKNISWKTYGLQLNFTPQIISKNKIQTKIEAEVSDLHESQSFNGIPGLKKSSYESLLVLNSDEPVIISGLIKQRQQNNSEGILGLSDIPILGSLFKSKQFVNNQSELIVVLKASLVEDN